MEENSKVETKEELNEKHYSLKIYTTSGSILTLCAALTPEKLHIFKNAFSDEEGVSQWLQQVMKSTMYIINLANICMVEINEIPTPKKKEEPTEVVPEACPKEEPASQEEQVKETVASSKDDDVENSESAN